AGFVDRGEKPETDEPIEILPGPEDFCWIHSPEITRTVVVDGRLYTVAHNGVGVHDFESGSRIDWITFDRL
ncbi:MAG: hypothetical protein OER95_16500, partial [Acidimicrobiia bacterium]|nr:hypothetical protein [Acidimicrobiia bacterium]